MYHNKLFSKGVFLCIGASTLNQIHVKYEMVDVFSTFYIMASDESMC